MALRGYEAGVFRINLDFHCSGVNSRPARFNRSQEIVITVIPLSGEDDRKDSDDKAPQKHTMKAYYSEETVARLKESIISRQTSI